MNLFWHIKLGILLRDSAEEGLHVLFENGGKRFVQNHTTSEFVYIPEGSKLVLKRNSDVIYEFCGLKGGGYVLLITPEASIPELLDDECLTQMTWDRNFNLLNNSK